MESPQYELRRIKQIQKLENDLRDTKGAFAEPIQHMTSRLDAEKENQAVTWA